MTDKRIVHRIEDGMDRREVYATSYQMRNFYRQLLDGFFTHLDVMNYIQHHQVTRWCKPGTRLLDVCCGRGLLLPLLRYHTPKIGGYTGVDLVPANATWTSKRVPDGKPLAELGTTLEDYYPFPVRFCAVDAAEMATHLPHASYDLVVYTSALEHMHHDVGLASLGQARLLTTPGGVLFLTTPKTEVGKDGYDTQYRAHVYEWQREELLEGLAGTGWQVMAEWGLVIKKRALKAAAEPLGLLPLVERLERHVPNEWLTSVLAPMFPSHADELALLCKAV